MQVLAWVKYGAIYFAACLAARGAPANAHHTKEQNVLMAIIGLMDVCAYAANCLGVAFCGAAVAALTLAATQQIFTAAMSYFLLGRRLSPHQMSAVSVQGMKKGVIWLCWHLRRYRGYGTSQHAGIDALCAD